MPKWKLPGQTSTVIDANTPEKREILFDLTNNRPRIGDGSTAGGKALAFQSETERGLREFNAAGDGVTDDTAAFVSFEAAHAGTSVDLLGKTYLITTDPLTYAFKNRYANGYFLYDGVKYPASGTLDFVTRRITSTRGFWAYLANPQDTGFSYDSRLYFIAQESDSHASKYPSVVLYTSEDGGVRWDQRALFRPTGAEARREGGFFCSAAGRRSDGRMVLVRRADGYSSDADDIAFKLFHRRLHQRVFLEDAGVLVSNGTTTLTVNHPGHGLVTNDRVSIDTNGETIGGVSPEGTRSITKVNANSYTMTLGSSATTASSSFSVAIDVLEGESFNGTTQWSVDGGEIDAVRLYRDPDANVSSGADIRANGKLSMWHDFTQLSDGRMAFGVSNPNGAGIVICDDNWSALNPTLYRFPESLISGASGGVILEPTMQAVTSGGVEYLVGFCRNDASNSAPLFFKFRVSDQTLTTYRLDQFHPVDREDYNVRRSTFPMIIKNGYIYAFPTQRQEPPGSDDLRDRATLRAFMIRASVTDALTNGASAFEVYDIGALEYSGETSGLGVGTVISQGDRIHFVYGACPLGVGIDEPDLYVTTIKLEATQDSGGAIQRLIDFRNEPYQASALPFHLKLRWNDSLLGAGFTNAKGTFNGLVTDAPAGTGTALDEIRDYRNDYLGELLWRKDADGWVTGSGAIDLDYSGASVESDGGIVIREFPFNDLEGHWRPDKDWVFPVIAYTNYATDASSDPGNAPALQMGLIRIIGQNHATRAERGEVRLYGFSADVRNITFDGVRFLANGDQRI